MSTLLVELAGELMHFGRPPSRCEIISTNPSRRCLNPGICSCGANYLIHAGFIPAPYSYSDSWRPHAGASCLPTTHTASRRASALQRQLEHGTSGILHTSNGHSPKPANDATTTGLSGNSTFCLGSIHITPPSGPLIVSISLQRRLVHHRSF
jgi:hypothetical protein